MTRGGGLSSAKSPRCSISEFSERDVFSSVSGKVEYYPNHAMHFVSCRTLRRLFLERLKLRLAKDIENISVSSTV